MSYDFATLQICTHKVLLETLIPDLSKRTLRFLRPPSSSVVQLYADGVEIPQQGLFLAPHLMFKRPEPYTINRDVNDLIYFKTGNNIPRLIPVNSGQYLRAKDVARDLSAKMPEINVDIDKDRVVLSAKTVTDATLFAFPDPRWTDKTSSLPTTTRILNFFNYVGIIPGRHITGKKCFPGWALVHDPSITFDDNEKIIRFEDSIPNSDPVLKVNYVTRSEFCRRCGGIRIEFDYNVVGATYEIVTDTDLLAQEFDKFLFTRLGSHFKWNWMGSGLIDRIGSKSNGLGAAISAIITSDISQAFNTYQNVKSQQDTRFPSQQVTDAEYPYALSNIRVQVPPDDPTTALAFVEITSRSQEPIVLKRVIGNPNPFTLSEDAQKLLQIGSSKPFLLRG